MSENGPSWRHFAQFKVFHDFQFEDRLAESRITFKHQVVEDAARQYKAIHYDHGNGVAGIGCRWRRPLRLLFHRPRSDPNQLWRNLGKGRFENITASAGVGLADRISVTASFADIDNDGDQDLYVTTVRTGNALFENLGAGKFKDITVASGLEYAGHSSGAVFFDYNRDGLSICF